LLLSQILQELGWEPLKPSGGVSLLASPKAYKGKQIAYETSLGQTTSVELDNVNITQVIFDCTKLRLISSNIPGFIQFGFSLQEEHYLRAIGALRKFQGMVKW
jgi:methionine S-methyltransferase